MNFYTDTFNQYAVYLSTYILYYSKKMVGVRVKIIIFHFAVTR